MSATGSNAPAVPSCPITAIPSAAFRSMAQSLLPSAQIIPGDLGSAKPGADLVIAAYVLAEQPEQIAGPIAVDLWKVTGKALVLVEPGTPLFCRVNPEFSTSRDSWVIS